MGRKPLPKDDKKKRIYIMIKSGEVKRAGGDRKAQQILKDKWDEHIGLIQRSSCFLFLLPAIGQNALAIIIITIIFILLLRWEILSNKWDEFDERDNYK
jgi:hypothetical protein